MDEPLSNLDTQLRTATRIELTALHRDLGTTFIYVTHDQVEAMTLADRIVVFNAGVVQQIGKPLDLYDNPRNIFVAGFLGAPRINLLAGKLVGNNTAEIVLPGGQHLFSATDTRRGAPDEIVTLGIRPEHVQLAEATDTGAIVAIIVLVEHLGDQVLAYINVAGVAEELCIKLPGHSSKLRYGDSIHVIFPREHCMLFDQNGESFTRLS
jgi:multiple sugar transport system ATP-binding protein